MKPHLIQPLLFAPEWTRWPLNFKRFTFYNKKYNYILHKVNSFETANPFFSEYTMYWLEHFFSSYGYLWSWYMHLKHISWGFNICHLTFGSKIVKVLGFHIWKHFPEIQKAKSSFKVLKSSPNRPKYKCKNSSYADNYS